MLIPMSSFLHASIGDQEASDHKRLDLVDWRDGGRTIYIYIYINIDYYPKC